MIQNLVCMYRVPANTNFPIHFKAKDLHLLKNRPWNRFFSWIWLQESVRHTYILFFSLHKIFWVNISAPGLKRMSFNFSLFSSFLQIFRTANKGNDIISQIFFPHLGPVLCLGWSWKGQISTRYENILHIWTTSLFVGYPKY